MKKIVIFCFIFLFCFNLGAMIPNSYIPSQNNNSGTGIGLEKESYKNLYIYDAVKINSNFINGSVSSGLAQNIPMNNNFGVGVRILDNNCYRQISIPENVAVELMRNKFFPEFIFLEKLEKSKDWTYNVDKYLESAIQTYKNFMMEKDENKLRPLYITSGTIKNLESTKIETEDLIKTMKEQICELQKAYHGIIKIKDLGIDIKKGDLLPSIVNGWRNVALKKAELSIINDKIKCYTKILNISIFDKASDVSSSIEREFSKKGQLTEDEKFYLQSSLERKKVAKTVYEQKIQEQQKDRIIDTSSISKEYLKENGYNQEDISKLNNATDLQVNLQKDFIFHIGESQNFKKEESGNGFLKPLIDFYEKTIKEGLVANKTGDVEKAMTLSDLCWRGWLEIKSLPKAFSNLGEVALEAVHSIDEVLGKGVLENSKFTKDFVLDFFKKPDQHMVKAAEGICEGVLNLAKDIGGIVEKVVTGPIESLKKVFKLAGNLYDGVQGIHDSYMDACALVAKDPDKAKENILKMKEVAKVLVDNFSQELAKTSKLEITKAIGEFSAKSYLTGEALKFVGKLVRVAKGEIVSKFEGIVDDLKNAKTVLAQTTEGVSTVVETVGQGLSEGISSSAEPAIEKTLEVVSSVEGESLVKESMTISNEVIKESSGSVEKNIKLNREKFSEEERAKILAKAKEAVIKMAPDACEIPGITIDKITGNINIDKSIISEKYGERLAKVGLDNFSEKNLQHIRHEHCIDGSKYLFNLIGAGEIDAAFNQCENFIELAVQVCEKGVKTDSKHIVYDFGRIVGLDKFGCQTSKVEVYLLDTLNGIRTVYPVPMGK